ncbi:MAG: ROK family transcriptional regulator [Actinomycetota bacterium]|nr:ROK family transcriptional regulator [Actinomycetota bacterium]
MNERRASRQLGKQINSKLILNLIKAGPISRAEIAAESGLSAATVSNLTSELIAEGLIRESGVGETTRGRPPVMLSLNSNARFVVGVKVMPDSLVAVVTDLDAEVVAQRVFKDLGEQVHRSGTLDTTPTAIVEKVAMLVEEVIRDAGINRSDLLGVGLGLAGFIDSNAGVCRYSPFFGWRDVNLAAPLTSALGLDVYLENDVNSLTIAEQWFGHGRGYEHFVVVTVGRGIGVGFVLNGRFYAGHQGGVGELGHVTVVPDGPKCGCGRRGCLEMMASDRALIQAARDAIADGKPTVLTDSDDITVKMLVAAAEQGDDLACSLIAESGRWLGVGLAMIVNLLNPELIIVAGEGVEAGDLRFDSMREALSEGQFDSLGTDTKLVVESSGDMMWARGAACVVLSEFFRSPLHRGRPSAIPLGGTG